MSKVIKKYRVTLQAQKAYLRDNQGQYIMVDGQYLTEDVIPLGFANAYEPNTKAYEKRKETQDNWAYGTGCFEVNGEYWRKETSWEPDGKGGHNRVFNEYMIPHNYQPIIIDNVPIEGFRVQKSVSRSSTSNKVWRILDPRGFELEIMTDTMEDLIHGGAIQSGLIIGKCIWRTAKILERV